MAYIPEATDPFSGGTKTPSLSWKGLPVGSAFRLEVLEPAKLIHSRNFETNEPDYWDTEKTQPKMSAVINVRVIAGPHSIGEDRSIWAQKPSNLFVAIADAQRAAGSRIEARGTLHLTFAGETPHENKRYSPIKQYTAQYTPPTSAARPDAFGEEGPSQPVQSTIPPGQGKASWATPAQPTQPARGTQQGTTPGTKSW